MRKRSIVTAFAVLALASAGGATAADQGTVQVSGIQSPVTAGPCWDASAVASFTMTGDLTGCWYLDAFTCRAQPSGTVECSGYEHFVGSIGDRSGTLYFANDFTGKFDFSTFTEIHGRCHHPILSGDGGFTGATGSLDFKDDVTTGCASYRGHIAF
jgi:Protein of unknown function (DUF3224)